MIAALLLLQAAAAPPPERFSILADPCPASTEQEVVVCARQPERLPPGVDAGPPDGPRRGTGDGREGLEHAGDGACVVSGCQVGIDVIGAGVAAVRLVGKLIDPNSCCEAGEATDPVALARDMVHGGKRALSRKPTNRVPIALDAPPPSLAGRLQP